jgi:hypothetical protein
MTTDSDRRTETWKPVPGFSAYEASDCSVWRVEDGRVVTVSGGIRSVDRTVAGRRLEGVLLTGRLNNSRGGGYVMVNMTDDTGAKRTMLAHRMILLAHVGECPEGLETLHDPARGRLWCRVPEDIRYGTRRENIDDWKKNNGAQPKPPKHCVRCSAEFTGNGRRCHGCVTAIGQEAAALLRSGIPLGAAAEQLEYPSLEGLHTLAVKYGGYGTVPPETPGWARRVMTTVRRLFPGGDAQ